MTAPIIAAAEDSIPGRPARPVRFEDPVKNAAYWQRIAAIVDQAPPLSHEQRIAIRLAIWGGTSSRRAAA